MATINSVEYAKGVAVPVQSIDSVNKHAELRLASATLVSDGTLINGVTSGGALGDTFNLFTIPAGARIVGFSIGFSGTPGASHTFSIGIVGALTAYRAAAVLPAGGQPGVIPAATWASAVLGVSGSSKLATDTLIVATGAVVAMPAGTCVVTFVYACD